MSTCASATLGFKGSVLEELDEKKYANLVMYAKLNVEYLVVLDMVEV